ncbi:MAG: helix-turn-helix transcriptional regulator [Chitinophagaceae bacterium]|nr:helix-turn-helix transcriptional regulator [Chitinophagaceae bacterium]
MLFRFPPIPVNPGDATFLTGEQTVYAKHKIETRPGKRTVLLTEHTLIFVMDGIKLLHFSGETVKAEPNSVVLLKKGIYVMAEYFEDGLTFEALMVFLPRKVLKAFFQGMEEKGPGASKDESATPVTAGDLPFLLFPANDLLTEFKEQYRGYFGRSFRGKEQLLSLKQQELLVLLANSSQGQAVTRFLRSAMNAEPEDLASIVKEYMLQPVTLEEMASLSNRSLASFKRDFQRYYQCPPRQWINRQRLEHARLLLNNTDQPVSDVALACGFESVSHFIRIFKKEFGITPHVLRAKKAIH